MKIGFISDTHHNLKNIDEVVSLATDVDIWIHAGDNIDDTEYLSILTDKPIYAVCGNTDCPTMGEADLIVEIPFHKIFLTHGDRYNVNRDLTYLKKQAQNHNCDIIIFGHTHVGTIIEDHGLTIINPGSTTQPRDGKAPSFMIGNLNTSNGQLNIQRIFLK